MELILKHNIFQFHDSYWRQDVGAAMGGRLIPGYANILMAEFDEKIIKISKSYSLERKEAILWLKQLFDDFFFLFVGSTKKLHQFLNEVNKINPSIQLTMSHTSHENENEEDRCDCEIKKSIPFLDTLVTIKEGRIDLDLYRKETDCNQYLLPSSCHSKQTTASIPYSLGLRIVRICNDQENREKTIFRFEAMPSRQRLP